MTGYQQFPKRMIDKIETTRSAIRESGFQHFYESFASFLSGFYGGSFSSLDEDDLQALTVEQLMNALLLCLMLFVLAFILLLIEIIIYKFNIWKNRRVAQHRS